MWLHQNATLADFGDGRKICNRCFMVNVAFKRYICAAFEVYLHAVVRAQPERGKAWKDITIDLGMKVIR